MKRAVLLVFLIAIISVNASYLAEPESSFKFRGGSCDSNGSMYLNLTHEGISVAYKDINITAESKDIAPVKLIGEWKSPNNYKLSENYTGSDFDSLLNLKFRTTYNIFTKADYIITLTWPSNTNHYNKVMFPVSCPGKTCKTDNDCVSEQRCYGQICEWLNCPSDKYAIGHGCQLKCEDYNKCTQDYYIEGQCVHLKIANCCNEDKDCDNSSECSDATCTAKSAQSLWSRIWNWLKNLY